MKKHGRNNFGLAGAEGSVQRSASMQRAGGWNQELCAFSVAIARCATKGVGAMGLGIGGGNEKADAFSAAILGGEAKGAGIIRHGVADGNEKLDAFGMASGCGECQRLEVP